MKLRALIWAALIALMPPAAGAFAPELPAGATMTVREIQAARDVNVPVGPFSGGEVPAIRTQGRVTSEAWRISTDSLSTLQILLPLRAQLEESGFEILMECETEACGGFDFRYSIELLPEPEMHVDLGDFRYLSARREREGGEPEFITLMVSRSANNAFIQVTHVGESEISSGPAIASSKSPDAAGWNDAAQPEAGQSLAGLLQTAGWVLLDDVRFATGSAKLEEDNLASLAELAAWLKANPDKTVALVGHTDAEGSLKGNMELSKRRAKAVMERLVQDYGVPRKQLEAAGVGYLAPRASNLTPEGRSRNRRVEAILTSTR
jgi:OOP family OmpA-OmpF porin